MGERDPSSSRSSRTNYQFKKPRTLTKTSGKPRQLDRSQLRSRPASQHLWQQGGCKSPDNAGSMQLSSRRLVYSDGNSLNHRHTIDLLVAAAHDIVPRVLPLLPSQNQAHRIPRKKKNEAPRRSQSTHGDPCVRFYHLPTTMRNRRTMILLSCVWKVCKITDGHAP